MKSNVKIIVMAILSVLVAFGIVFMLIYLIVGAAEQKSAKKQEVSSSVSVSEDSGGETVSEDVSGETALTVLYSVDEDSDFYLVNSETGVALFDYADGTLGGLYTGRPSETYDGYIELDYNDAYALVSELSAMPVSGAKVLPVGTISQITSDGEGYSGCGPACLYMMLRNLGTQTQSDIQDYKTLLYFAEENDLADQGSLLNYGGGMSADKLIELAKEAYNLEMVNAYTEGTKPSETLKNLIDDGKQAVVLVKHEDGNVVTNSEANSHFLLVTGYTESGGELYFLYANSYYLTNVSHGNPLRHIKAELLDESAAAQFDEPNAILYINS